MSPVFFWGGGNGGIVVLLFLFLKTHLTLAVWIWGEGRGERGQRGKKNLSKMFKICQKENVISFKMTTPKFHLARKCKASWCVWVCTLVVVADGETM